MLTAEKCQDSLTALKPSESYTSYSRLQTLMLCPKKYEYRYILGEKPQDVSISMLFGKAQHLQYQAWLKNEPFDMAEAFLTILDEFEAEINWGKETPEDVFRWSEAFTELLVEEERPYRLLGTEVEFRLPLGEEKDLLGFIDAVVENENGSITGIEFKTAARAYGNDQLQFNHQPTVYILGLSQMFPGRKIKFQYLVFTKTKNPKLLTYHVTRSQRQLQELGDLISYQDRISLLGVYPRIRSWMCNNCEYRDKCNGGN